MKKIVFFILMLVLLTGGISSYQSAKAQQNISPEIARLIQENGADNAFWTLTVRDSTGKILEAYHTQKLIRPASNLKLLTAATVLDELGSDFTYKTHIYGIGQQQDDIWQGNIIIRGSGDPSISGEFYNDDRLHVMHALFEILESRGITEINGNLIGNDSYFDQKPYPDGWSWDDLTFYYAVPVNALSFNNNTVDLTVYANGEVGETPEINWFPFDTDYVEFINDQLITPRNAAYDEYYQRLLGTNTVVLRSSLPKGYVEKEALSITNPPLYFLDTFKKYLEDGGIEVKGSLIVDSSPHDWSDLKYQKLGTHESPPFGKLLNQLNKESNNFYAEMMLKTAAAEHYDTRGSTELGISLAENFASSAGIDPDAISMADGSGLAGTNLISTHDLSKLLVYMRNHREFEAFEKSLAVGGVDGSLEHRLGGSPLIYRLKAKTGFISGVRTLSGYLKAKSNKTLIFSIATNNYTTETSYIDSIQESILEVLYERY